MKNKSILYVAGGILLLVFMGFLFSGNDDAYRIEIEKYWEDRIDFLKNSDASPLQQHGQPFEGVSYFNPDKKYRVSATLDRYTKREVMAIGNSDGSVTNYLKFAYANFKIDGTDQRLLILKALGFGNNYFTAFGDATSGISTYGGGRYLDLAIGKSNDITIDFNKAYHPYCAYVDDYACPLPPSENLLEVEIAAGEKN